MIRYKLLIFFLFIWLIVAVGRTVNNASKLFTQDWHLFYVSKEQRMEETYGDIAILVKEISKITKGKPFLLTGNDGKLYFFLRYLLYPQKVYWVNNITRDEEKERSWKYVFYPYDSSRQSDARNQKIVDHKTGRSLGIVTSI